MDAKLKYLYIFFLSFVVGTVSSCTSYMSDDVYAGKGSELSFDVSALSRGSVYTDINVSGNKFAVYGDRAFSETNSGRPVVVFNKTEVEYKYGEWLYNNLQFWEPQQEYSFVALFPLSVLDDDNNVYADSRLSLTYTIPASSGGEITRYDVTDILGATHRRYYQSGNGVLPVTFSFDHLMSLVNFAPALVDNSMGSNAYMMIKKIELTGLKNKATFNILPAPRLTGSQTDDRVIEVSEQDGEITMTVEFDRPKRIMNYGESVYLFDDNDALIMLPQAFTADSQAKIILTYTINNEQDETTTSCPLSLLKWESGKSYSYKLTVDRTSAKFDSCEINPWNTVSGDNITVD